MALTDKLSDIGDAIRLKTGGTSLLTLPQMAEEISNIKSGGVLQSITIDRNGTYTPPTDVDGYNEINVNVGTSGDLDLWATGTWQEIGDVLDGYYSGTITNLSQYFKIGSKRKIFVNDINTDSVVLKTFTEGRTYDFVILGIEHDDLADGSGKAALTIGMDEAYYTSVYRGSSSTSPTSVAYSNSSTLRKCLKWDECELHTWLQNTYKSALPIEIQNLLKQVTKSWQWGKTGTYSYAVSSGRYNTYVTLPSFYETFGYNINDISINDQEQYGYYKEHIRNIYIYKSLEEGEIPARTVVLLRDSYNSRTSSSSSSPYSIYSCCNVGGLSSQFNSSSSFYIAPIIFI